MSNLLLRQATIEASQAGPLPEALERPAHAPTSRLAPIAFELVTDMAHFEALEPEWNDLFSRAGRPEHVFQTFAWNWHWCRHYLVTGPRDSGPHLAIVAGRFAGRLALLMPLVVTRKWGLRQLSWMGEPVSQYGDAVATPEASDLDTLMAAWAFAVASTHADVAFLRKVRSDAVVAPLLAALGMRVTATEDAPFIDLTQADSYETYQASRSPKRQKNRRRHMRRLQERGTVSFESYAGTRDAADLAAYAILMKRASLKSKDQLSLALADDRFASFFADVAHGRSHPVSCKVLAIRSNGEIAAMKIILENGAASFLHVAVYASKFEKCGAGGLLFEHAIADGYDHGIKHFDLLPPRHEYKMDFADGVITVSDYAGAPTALGRAYASGVLGTRHRIKAAIEAMPAPLRRAMGTVHGALKRGG